MKKGFTLIELLAVIVILAVIALIATPIILNIIEDTRVQSMKRSIDNYARALETEIARKQLTEANFTIDDAIEGLQYNGSRVSCETRRILKSGEIYLDNCSVDGEVIENYSYGKKKYETSPMILTGETANNKITGYTLDKTGNIGLDIYAKVSGASHITYSISGESTVSVDPKKDKEGNTYYTVPVSPAYMTRSIVIKLYSGETEVDSLTTTIKDYCNTILSDSSYSDSHELIKAVVTMGRHAQEYFNKNTSDLADSILSEPVDLSIVESYRDYINTLTYHATSGVRTDYGIKTYNFELSSNIGMRILIELKNNATIDTFSFTFQGEPITATPSGARYELSVKYGYLNFANEFTYTFKNGNDVFVLTEAPLAVMLHQYDNPGFNAAKNVFGAIMYYYFIANSYYYN